MPDSSAPAASLGLVDLTDAAIVRRRLSRGEVVETLDHAATVMHGRSAWARTGAASIVWNSRRSADRLSYLLFIDPHRDADRARAVNRRDDLEVARPPLPLYDGAGLADVLVAATERNVTVVF